MAESFDLSALMGAEEPPQQPQNDDHAANDGSAPVSAPQGDDTALDMSEIVNSQLGEPTPEPVMSDVDVSDIMAQSLSMAGVSDAAQNTDTQTEQSTVQDAGDEIDFGAIFSDLEAKPETQQPAPVTPQPDPAPPVITQQPAMPQQQPVTHAVYEQPTGFNLPEMATTSSAPEFSPQQHQQPVRTPAYADPAPQQPMPHQQQMGGVPDAFDQVLAPQPKKRGKGLLVAGISVVVVAALGGSAYFALTTANIIPSFVQEVNDKQSQAQPEREQSADTQEQSSQSTTVDNKDSQLTDKGAETLSESGVGISNSTDTGADQAMTDMQKALTGLVKSTGTLAKDKSLARQLDALANKASSAPVSQGNIDYLAEQIVVATKKIASPDITSGKGEILSVEASLQNGVPVLVVITSEPMDVSLVGNVNGKVTKFNPQRVSGVATFILDQDKGSTTGAYAYVIKGGSSELSGVRTY